MMCACFRARIPLRLPARWDEVLARARSSGQRETRESALGLRLQELTPELASRLGYEGESGVLKIDWLYFRPG